MAKFWNNEAIDWKIEFTFDGEANVLRKPSIQLTAVPGRAVMQADLGQRGNICALSVKRGVAAALNELKRIGAESVLVDAFGLTELMGADAIDPLVIGARLAAHKPISFKQGKEKEQDEDDNGLCVYIACNGTDQELDAIARYNVVADGLCIAQDMVNTPPNKLTPDIMARQIAEHCAKHAIPCDVFDEKFMTQHRMGAFLAVGMSSGNMPRMIVLRHMGDPANPGDITAIIGKALTFDTGGYNLKPGSGMKEMKCDMAGGASAFAAVMALARNNAKANVVAVIPAAENRVSRESFLPSDVLHTMSGRTVEVISTDAEGRLCMSDCMTYAIRHEKATRLIDIATLTGSAVAALGKKTAATMSNDDAFYGRFLNAAKLAAEQYWRMPNHDEYYLMIEGQIADIKNAPEDGCGIMAAGLFMEFFAEGLPWIHMDIAGTAFSAKPGYEFHKPGATGAGMQTLYEMFAGRI
ncbi:MAG: leucyl aminopeptidase family protein [Defluviitaleaceae bacterium]|nr:leucyl aminopeptidase family protein [Defluviitaleaceae bacterium]